MDPCIICGKTIMQPGMWTKTLGPSTWELCSARCASLFDSQYLRPAMVLAQAPTATTPPSEPDRKGPYWDLVRAIDNRIRSAENWFAEWKMQRKFKRIQRQARRGR